MRVITASRVRTGGLARSRIRSSHFPRAAQRPWDKRRPVGINRVGLGREA